jgi:hypothetical protein
MNTLYFRDGICYPPLSDIYSLEIFQPKYTLPVLHNSSFPFVTFIQGDVTAALRNLAGNAARAAANLRNAAVTSPCRYVMMVFHKYPFHVEGIRRVLISDYRDRTSMAQFPLQKHISSHDTEFSSLTKRVKKLAAGIKDSYNDFKRGEKFNRICHFFRNCPEIRWRKRPDCTRTNNAHTKSHIGPRVRTIKREC